MAAATARAKIDASRRKAKKGGLTSTKACKIVRDGKVHGKPLSKKQRGFFGARCGEGKK